MPITFFSGWRSANPRPGSAVSNGMALLRSHSFCSFESGVASTPGDGTAVPGAPMPSSKSRLTGLAAPNCVPSSAFCSLSNMFVDGTSLPTASSWKSSTQTLPLPARSNPKAMFRRFRGYIQDDLGLLPIIRSADAAGVHVVEGQCGLLAIDPHPECGTFAGVLRLEERRQANAAAVIGLGLNHLHERAEIPLPRPVHPDVGAGLAAVHHRAINA